MSLTMNGSNVCQSQMDQVSVKAKWTNCVSQPNRPSVCHSQMDQVSVTAKWTKCLSQPNGPSVCQSQMDQVSVKAKWIKCLSQKMYQVSVTTIVSGDIHNHSIDVGNGSHLSQLLVYHVSLL